MDETNNKNLRQIRVAIILIAAIIVLCAFKLAAEVSLVLVLSIFLFLMLSPIARNLEKAKLPAALATLISMLILLFMIIAAMVFFFYAVDLLIRTLPKYSGRLAELEDFITIRLRSFMDLPPDFSLIWGLEIDWIGVLLSALRQVSTMTFNIVKKGILCVIFVMFLLMERDTIIPKAIEMIRGKDSGHIEQIYTRINKQVSKYLVIKTLISLITGLAFFLITKAVGLEFSSLCAVLAFVLNFIPTIGSVIATLLAIVIAILQFFPSWSPILFIVFSTITIEWVLGNIIDPRLQGNQLNLSPFMILFSLTLWGYIWGIVGMFLAVPMMSILQIIFANIDQTKPFAVLFSSGKAGRERPRKRKGDPEQDFKDSIILPEDRQNRKK